MSNSGLIIRRISLAGAAAAVAVGGLNYGAIARADERIPTPPAVSAEALHGLDPAMVEAERQIDQEQWRAVQAKIENAPTADEGLAAVSKQGYTGEVWVSLAAQSGSIGFAGHAAVIAQNAAQTIESFAQKWSPVKRDGVVILSNSWGSRSGVLRLGVKGSNPTKRAGVASWAKAQNGKPYNWNFFDKNTESKFYCSQLAWKAWLKQGINIEEGSLPNGAVTPADLVNSSNTTINYRS